MLLFIQRDLKILLRDPKAWLLCLIFFLLFTAILAIALSGSPDNLQLIAPAGIWLAAIFSLILSFDGLFERDIRNGVLEQIRLSNASFFSFVASKALTVFVLSCLPLICAIPIAGLFVHMPVDVTQIVMISILIGSPAMIALGIFSASILSGSRQAGFLLALLTLPFFVPIVIFAIGGINAFPEIGFWNTGFIALMGISLVMVAICIPASVAALQSNLE